MTNIPIINNINAILGGRTERLKLWEPKNHEYELQQAVIYVAEFGQDLRNFIESSPLISEIAYKLRYHLERIKSPRLHSVVEANEILVELLDCINQTNSYWDSSKGVLICNFIDSSLASHEHRYSQCARIKDLYFKLYGTPIPLQVSFKSFLDSSDGTDPIYSQHTYDNAVAWVNLLESEPTLLNLEEVSKELELCKDYINTFNRDDLPQGEPIKTANDIWLDKPETGNHFRVHWEDIKKHQYFSNNVE